MDSERAALSRTSGRQTGERAKGLSEMEELLLVIKAAIPAGAVLFAASSCRACERFEGQTVGHVKGEGWGSGGCVFVRTLSRKMPTRRCGDFLISHLLETPVCDAATSKRYQR